MKGEIKPFTDGEELFMRLAATGRDAGSVSKESVCWWLARAFATIDQERAKVKKLRAALGALCDASPLATTMPLEDAKPFSEAYGTARAALVQTA